MKIRACVIEAADHGDQLLVKAQGRTKQSADWQGCATIEMKVPMHNSSRKAFYIGRPITVEIKPF